MMITLRTLALIWRTEGVRQAIKSALYFANPWRAKGRCVIMHHDGS